MDEYEAGILPGRTTCIILPPDHSVYQIYSSPVNLLLLQP